MVYPSFFRHAVWAYESIPLAIPLTIVIPLSDNVTAKSIAVCLACLLQRLAPTIAALFLFIKSELGVPL